MFCARRKPEESSGRHIDSPVPCHHNRAASHEQVSLDEVMCVARDRLAPERIRERLQMDSADEVLGHAQGLIQH